MSASCVWSLKVCQSSLGGSTDGSTRRIVLVLTTMGWRACCDEAQSESLDVSAWTVWGHAEDVGVSVVGVGLVGNAFLDGEASSGFGKLAELWWLCLE